MKSQVVSTAILALTLSSGAIAEDKKGEKNSIKVSGNIALVSDYKFRGISQTDGGPAVQGGFDLDFGNGFYLGTWGSNVDFANSLELDYYGGYRGKLNESLSFDVGYIYYDYPSTPDEDPYAEVYGKLGFAGVTLGLAYSDDYYLESGKFLYAHADYATEVCGFGLNFHLGHNAFDSDKFLDGAGDRYLDYSAGISREWGGVELGLSIIDTDLDNRECFGEDWCDLSAVLSISKTL
ncbi:MULTISPECIES: TorF family putative porin [unclassified Microbulbifer]|uniref:TorF family putative porin n=1 Tax=unclassified Microbulbifer TaxID=2619833 RepID=UPI0027E4D79E|nr:MULTISPECIES: TorF family putative porin [unclassified Microbulbifer]